MEVKQVTWHVIKYCFRFLQREKSPHLISIEHSVISSISRVTIYTQKKNLLIESTFASFENRLTLRLFHKYLLRQQFYLYNDKIYIGHYLKHNSKIKYKRNYLKVNPNVLESGVQTLYGSDLVAPYDTSTCYSMKQTCN